MKISSSIKDSLELKFSSLAKGKNLRGEKILSLGLGEPSFDTPSEIIDAAHKAMREGYTRYSNPFGLIDLRELLAENLRTTKGIQAETDELMITTGAKMALTLALSVLLEPGDEVINLTPCYPSYIPQILLAEPTAHIQNIDLFKKDYSLDYDNISNSITPRTKALLINFPNNPTGKILSLQDMRFFEYLVANHPNLYLISDEIYDGLCFSGISSYSPASSSYIQEKVITVSGFSKTYSMTGWRIGYLHCSKELMHVISKIQQHVITNVPVFIQKAAIAALSMNKQFLLDYNILLASNFDYLTDTLGPLSSIRVRPSHGGLFAFVDISNTNLSSDQFASALLNEFSVAVTPGLYFGENWDDHIRISLAPDRENFAEAVDSIHKFLTSKAV